VINCGSSEIVVNENTGTCVTAENADWNDGEHSSEGVS